MKTALEDIGGDRKDLAGGMSGRNLFGRGLSDVLRAHHNAVVQTFDGSELTIARGEWSQSKTGRWTINREYQEKPQPKHFKETYLNPETSGTAARFVAGCRIGGHLENGSASATALSTRPP
ncbi:MAG: hypothetical protein MUF81_08270 [Verrucomicrobia bacterium]|nr:hypothetical protein [Verrucomicrobiota bacterium]